MGCQEASAAALSLLSSLLHLLPPQSGRPGSAMVSGLQLALRGADNIGRSGGSDQLKAPNGQIERGSSVVEHTLFLNWFP